MLHFLTFFILRANTYITISFSGGKNPNPINWVESPADKLKTSDSNLYQELVKVYLNALDMHLAQSVWDWLAVFIQYWWGLNWV